MELMLLAVTVVSLLVALVMSAAAWRVSREERARSSARVAALAAAASDTAVVKSDVPVAEPVDRPHRAAEPRVPGEPRAPWAPARVSSFAASTRPAAQSVARVPDLVLYPPTTDSVAFREFAPTSQADPVAQPAAMADDFLGRSVAQQTGGGQRHLAIAAAVLFFALAGGGYWAVFGDHRATTPAAAAHAASSSPLELVSLRHERNGARLAVSGLVRNPVAAGTVERLTAVVFLFDQQGGFVTSAKAGVDFTRLAPGDESPFVISVDAPSSVARYRVSFRTESGIVPHVDRRGQDPVAPNTVGQNSHASAVR